MIGKSRLLCSVAAGAMILAAATAHEGRAQESTPKSNFAGFYIGTHVGYGEAEYSGIVSPGNGSPGDLEIEGFLTGIHLGHNWQLGSNFIGGLEGDLTLAPWDGAKAHPNHDTQFVSGHLSGIATLRARLGFEFDRALLYVTGGVAFASSNASGGHTAQFNRRAEITVGGVLGGGLEYFLTQNLAIRAEGLYYLFNQKQSPNGSMTGFAGIDSAWMARFGASWYFDQEALFARGPATDAFSGFYIGGHIGYGNAEYTGFVDAGAQPDPGDADANGFLIGGHIGYNWNVLHNILLGIEGDLSLTPWGAAALQPGQSTDFVSGHITGIASLRGRLGFLLDASLLYVTGGVAFASTNSTGGDTTHYSDRDKIEVGGVVGAGLEFLTTENMSIRAEGLYYMFNQSKQGDNGNTGAAGLNDAWVARIGASWYFDGADMPNPEPMDASFAGFYLGGHLGYGGAEYSGFDGNIFAQHEIKGFLGGIHAGYNWDTIHNFLFGIETDVTLMSWDGADDEDNGTDYVSGHLNGIASLRGRLGFTFDRALIYGTGGIALASTNASGGSTLQFNDRTELEFGPVVGAGLEFLATENLALRAEGLHYWFDQNDGGNGGTGFAGLEKTWAFRVGASWYFN